MAKLLFLFVFLFSVSLLSTGATESCETYRFPSSKNFISCKELDVLNSSIHWNYHPSSHTVDIALRHSTTEYSSSRWVAWAINPTAKTMIGSQVFVAFQRTDGTLAAYTSPITSYGTHLEQGNLSFPVYNVSAIYENEGVMIIFASLGLQSNTTIVNHVWQEGPVVGNNDLGIHKLSGPNLKSFGTLDFLSGKIEFTSSSSVNSIGRIKIVHGALNAVSWGFLMPVGAAIARYVKVFEVADPAWFYLHVTCQSSAVGIGLIGGGLGFWLGHKSSGIKHTAHQNIGIALFCSAIFQVLVAKFSRPNKGHKFRVYWNACHYLIGYGAIILSIFNVFEGFHILESGKMWKVAYLSILIALGCIAIVLEAFTWFVVLKRKHTTEGSDKSSGDGTNP